jgi:SAM-dependent methyltransferase
MDPALSTTGTVAQQLTELCVCPRCFSPLRARPGGVECTSCDASYPIEKGVLDLLPGYDEDERLRYLANYEEVAKADLEHPFEHDRHVRHSVLLDFIGDVDGLRVLDVGSSHGGYLTQMRAGQRVALDIAAPFLDAIPEDSGIVRIRADAETLPVGPGTVDVVIVSDVLEHLLEPERLVQRLMQIATPATRLIVHVPWEENLSRYDSSSYEFTHLRSFTRYTFAQLFFAFRIARERATYPALEEPLVFRTRRFVPLWAYNVLTWRYFHRDAGAKEYGRRARWIQELPRRERWLVRFYRPLFMMFELRLLEEARSRPGYLAPLPAGLGGPRAALRDLHIHARAWLRAR